MNLRLRHESGPEDGVIGVSSFVLFGSEGDLFCKVSEPLNHVSRSHAVSRWFGLRGSCSAERESRRRLGGHALGQMSVLPCGPWRVKAFYRFHPGRCPFDRLSVCPHVCILFYFDS